MNHFIPVLSLVALGLSQVGCQETRDARQPAPNQGSPANLAASPADAHPKDAPALLEDEPLLLLDEGLDLGQPVEGGADNSRCAVCHLNLIREELALTHAQAEIGCADCHGPSDAHIADESWASGGNGTAPDIMFPKDRINPACLECHSREDLPEDEHEALFAGTSKEKYCTECHGEHRLVNRKCKWK